MRGFGRRGVLGLAGCLVASVLVLAGAMPAAAGTAQDVTVDLSSVFNQDAVYTPGTPTKGGTSLDTKGSGFGAASWPTTGTLTTSTFTSASGSAVTGSAATFHLPPASNTAFNAVINAGQTIAVSPGHYSEIYFLGAATWGPVSTALALGYKDGTTSQVPVTWPDWWGPGDPATAVIKGTATNGTQPIGLYAFSYPVDPAHTLQSVKLPGTLPTHNGGPAALHVFAISLEPAAVQASASAPSSLPKTGMPLWTPLGAALSLATGLLLVRRRSAARR